TLQSLEASRGRLSSNSTCAFRRYTRARIKDSRLSVSLKASRMLFVCRAGFDFVSETFGGIEGSLGIVPAAGYRPTNRSHDCFKGCHRRRDFSLLSPQGA